MSTRPLLTSPLRKNAQIFRCRIDDQRVKVGELQNIDDSFYSGICDWTSQQSQGFDYLCSCQLTQAPPYPRECMLVALVDEFQKNE